MNNNYIYKRIIAKIKLLLLMKDMTNEDLGDAIGWGKAAVGHWLRLERMPPNEALQKIADIMSIPREFFFKEFANNMQVYETAELYDMTEDEFYYFEAMSDYVRTIQEGYIKGGH